MNLTSAHRDFLLREQVFIPVLVNFSLNALAAWLTFRSRSMVPLWGAAGLWADTLVTLFILPFITCLIVTPIVRKAVLLGRVPSVPWRSSALASLRWLPRQTLVRSVVMGMTTTAMFGPLATLGMSWLRGGALPLLEATLLKGAIGAVVGGAVTPLAALYAMGAAPLQAVPTPSRDAVAVPVRG